jgi:hypothetical protein
MDDTDESIITGMDCNPQWMFSFEKLKPRKHLLPPMTNESVPLRNIGEGNKTIDIKPDK